MEGTIYLKRNSKTEDPPEPDDLSDDGLMEDNDLEGFSGGGNNQEYYEEDTEPEDLIEDVEDRTEWRPGFLQPEEELEKEAVEISENINYGSPQEKVETNTDVEKNNEQKNTSDPEITEEDLYDSDYFLGHLSKPFIKYLAKFKNAAKVESKKSPNPIYVDEIASKVAKLYETIRRVVDWKEAHLIRRAAIERMLKRRFVSKVYGISIMPDVDPAEASEPFVLELIRSGYFANGKIAKEKIFEIQELLEKYLYLLSNSAVNGNGQGGKTKKELKAGVKKKINLYNWIIEMAACEIEEVLDAPLREYALLDFMTECLLERIKVLPEGALSEDDIYIQTYIAVHRTLFNLDNPIIAFHLIKYKYPEFFSSKDYISEFTERILEIWDEIEGYLNYEKSSEFFKVADKYDAAYLMIGDAMDKSEKEPESLDEKVADPGMFLSIVERCYKARLATLKKRLSKLAVFSTLSIFVAGGASLLIFEIPVAKLITGEWSPWAIVADLAIPTALMFILVWMIKPPSDNNLEIVKEEASKIVIKPEEELDVYEVRVQKKVRKALNIIFFLVYLTGGIVSLYGIYYVFELAHVPWTSLYINTANVAMVVASAMIIRQRSKELTVYEKANVIEFLLDFFSIPLAKIGAWFSQKWKEYNIVSVLFVALVDFPFSSFVAILEGWRGFIKEKRTGLN